MFIIEGGLGVIMIDKGFSKFNDAVNEVYGSNSKNFRENIKTLLDVIKSDKRILPIFNRYLELMSQPEIDRIVRSPSKDPFNPYYFSLPKTKEQKAAFILGFFQSLINMEEETERKVDLDSILYLAYHTRNVEKAYDRFIKRVIWPCLSCFYDAVQEELLFEQSQYTPKAFVEILNNILESYKISEKTILELQPVLEEIAQELNSKKTPESKFQKALQSVKEIGGEVAHDLVKEEVMGFIKMIQSVTDYFQ